MDSRPQRTSTGIAAVLLLILLVAGAAAGMGCGAAASTAGAPPATAPPATSSSLRDPAASTRAYAVAASADLDGDGTDETVWLGRGPGAVWIDDGGSSYSARVTWDVKAAALGDTDRDGLPEVVALLEDAAGTHVGLIAWRRDRYRERLVTSPIVPPPTSLTVRRDDAAGGDVIDLGEGGGRVSTYRWNGFGFTVVERAWAE